MNVIVNKNYNVEARTSVNESNECINNYNNNYLDLFFNIINKFRSQRDSEN